MNDNEKDLPFKLPWKMTSEEKAKYDKMTKAEKYQYLQGVWNNCKSISYEETEKLLQEELKYHPIQMNVNRPKNDIELTPEEQEQCLKIMRIAGGVMFAGILSTGVGVGLFFTDYRVAAIICTVAGVVVFFAALIGNIIALKKIYEKHQQNNNDPNLNLKNSKRKIDIPPL